jgi:tetratricopeptide (TPR) repeat protein
VKKPEDVLKENPGSVIFARYAEELARNGKIDDAIGILSNGINANPDYAAGYSVLAEINANQKLHEAAIEHLEKSIALEPQAPRDLFSLGKFLVNSQPEKAKEYFWKAHQYEPEASDVKSALEKILSEKTEATEVTEVTEADEVEVVTDEEGVHPGMIGKVQVSEEMGEDIEDTVEVDEAALEEFGEETDISLSVEEDEALFIEETEKSLNKETDVEDEKIISDESTEKDIEPTSKTEDAFSGLVMENDISVEDEEMLEDISDLDESIVEESLTEKDISMAPEIDELLPADETEAGEILEEEQEADAEKGITVEEEPDIADTQKNKGFEEVLSEVKTESTEKEMEQITPHTEEQIEKIEEELPGYSEILGKDGSTEYDASALEQGDTGVLEIEDESNEYNASEIEYDLSVEESEEPVLTEEERAELLALEDYPEDAGKDTDILEDEITQPDSSELSGISEKIETATEDSDDIMTENAYGDLSTDEIENLSITDTEPDDVEKNLEIEMEEGIDYSDILYGHEPHIEPEDVPETISEEKKRSEDELELEPAIEDISPHETEEDTSNASIDTEESVTDTEEKPLTGDEISSEETLTVEPDIVPEAYPSVDESDDLTADESEVLKDESKHQEYFGLPVGEEEISDVKNSNLDELIDDYVTALKDSQTEPEQGEIDNSEETISSDSISAGKEIELELSGEKYPDSEFEEVVSSEGESTATMAEIFVSQGLIPRAIEIYKILLEQQPDNEEIQIRLEELQKMLDTQSGAE